jgi:hypothetical protein
MLTILLGQQNMTPLFMASLMGRVSAISVLLKAGADVHAATTVGDSCEVGPCPINSNPSMVVIYHTI